MKNVFQHKSSWVSLLFGTNAWTTRKQELQIQDKYMMDIAQK